jgi:hypothetical protein
VIESMRGLLAGIRRALATQMELQENYARRHDLSGLETRAAARQLRWVGDELVGCELP